MNKLSRSEFFASGGQTEASAITPSTGDPDIDAVMAVLPASAEPPFDPDAYLEQKIAEEGQALAWLDDDELAKLGPVIYGTWTRATPEQMARQIERCCRENVPGWQFNREMYEQMKDWGARQAAVAAEIPDYFSVLGAVTTPIPRHLCLAMRQSPAGAWVAYYLAKYPEALDRLVALPPEATLHQFAELERIAENRLRLQFDPRLLVDWTPSEIRH